MNVFETIVKFLRQTNSSEVIYILGAGILAFWLLRNSLGRRALTGSQLRRNNMPRYVPFAVLIFWVTITTLGLVAADYLLKNEPNEVGALWDNLIQCFGSTVSIVLMVFLAHRSFARRLKGFGFSLRKLPKDIPFAFLNLLAAWPVVAAVLVVTGLIGKRLFGPTFEIEPHQELQTLRQYSQWPIAAVIFINAAIVTSIFEEMLFRGLFQTMIRSHIYRPWLSILLSSVLFALAHVNVAHWPALFVLGVCLGYTYEKSGSLFRPIIIHSTFNGLSVIAVLLAAWK
jgi:membrane protease YdiL (CAAX protease family)